jgi:hypothetical protein
MSWVGTINHPIRVELDDLDDLDLCFDRICQALASVSTKQKLTLMRCEECFDQVFPSITRHMRQIFDMDIYFVYDEDGRTALFEGLARSSVTSAPDHFKFSRCLSGLASLDTDDSPAAYTEVGDTDEILEEYFEDPQRAIQGHAQLLYMNLPLLEITFSDIDFSALETHRVFCHAASLARVKGLTLSGCSFGDPTEV